MQAAKNVQDTFGLTATEWHNLVGKKVHLGVGVGQITEDAIFVGLIEGPTDNLYIPPKGYDEDQFVLNHLYNVNRIRVELNQRVIDLFWGDVVELWPLEELTNQ